MQGSGKGSITNLLPNAFAEDIAPFLQENFDPLKWIEKQSASTLNDRAETAPVMQMSDVLNRINYRLQLVSDSTTGALTRSQQQGQQSLLKIHTPLQTLHGKSTSQSERQHVIRKDISVIENSSNSSIESLASVHAFRHKLVHALELSTKVREAQQLLSQLTILPDTAFAFFMHCKQQHGARTLVYGVHAGKELNDKIHEYEGIYRSYAITLVSKLPSLSASMNAEYLVHILAGIHVLSIAVEEPPTGANSARSGGNESSDHLSVTVQQCTKACTAQDGKCIHHKVLRSWMQRVLEQIPINDMLDVTDMNEFLVTAAQCIQDILPTHSLYKDGRMSVLWKVMQAFVADFHQRGKYSEQTSLLQFQPGLLACMESNHAHLATNILQALDELCCIVAKPISTSSLDLPTSLVFAELPQYISSILPIQLRLSANTPVSGLQLLEKISTLLTQSVTQEEYSVHEKAVQLDSEELEKGLLRILETSAELKLSLSFSTAKLRRQFVPKQYMSKLHVEVAEDGNITVGNGGDVLFVLDTHVTTRTSHARAVCETDDVACCNVNITIEPGFWTEASARLQWQPLRSSASVRVDGSSVDVDGQTAFGDQTGFALDVAKLTYILQSRSINWLYDRVQSVNIDKVDIHQSYIAPFSNSLLVAITRLQNQCIDTLAAVFQKSLTPGQSQVYAQETLGTEGPSSILTKVADPIFAYHAKISNVSTVMKSSLDITPERISMLQKETGLVESHYSLYNVEMQSIDQLICTSIFNSIGRILGSRQLTVQPTATQYRTNIIEQSKRDCIFIKRLVRQVQAHAPILNALQIVLESGKETTQSPEFHALLVTLVQRDQDWLHKIANIV